MGLAQKRISKEFQDTQYPDWQKKLYSIMGFEVPIEVKWDTMMNDDYSEKQDYFDWYQAVYFRPLIETFQNICVDDLGKEALKSVLKKITIDGTEGIYASHSKFDNGELHILHAFNSNVDQIDDRIKGWTEMIGNKL